MLAVGRMLAVVRRPEGDEDEGREPEAITMTVDVIVMGKSRDS